MNNSSDDELKKVAKRRFYIKNKWFLFFFFYKCFLLWRNITSIKFIFFFCFFLNLPIFIYRVFVCAPFIFEVAWIVLAGCRCAVFVINLFSVNCFFFSSFSKRTVFFIRLYVLFSSSPFIYFAGVSALFRIINNNTPLSINAIEFWRKTKKYFF